MPDVTISYKGNSIATMSASGTKTLLTEAKYCEDDITIDYVKPSAPAPTLQAKSNISPTLSSQTITADNGYDGLSSVQINAMPSGSATTPATTIPANPSISVNLFGEITASVSKSQKVTPTVSAGYVSSGTYGTVTVSGSSTEQLTTKAAATYTPTTTNQTIAAGRYLTGAQTILGDQNLIPGNIKDGVSIFSVQGNYTGGGGGGGTAKTVTVTLGYPTSPSYFQSVTIYEGVYADTSPFSFTRGEQIGTITSATGSATVTVSAESNGIECVLRGGYLYVSQGGLHLEGAIGGMNVFPSGDSPQSIFFAVAGNGLVELDFIDWDD